jgi:hypothetical protein
MKDIKRYFGWMIVILVLHLAEQFIFGIDELEEVKQFGRVFYGWFSNPDYASVALIGLIVLAVQLMVYAMLAGGRWQLIPAGYFAIAGIGEIHHVVKTIAHGAYFPGAVTAIAFSAVGVFLFRAVVREWRQQPPRIQSAAA